MALYLIGDLQGCDAALQGLLEKIAFTASRDTLYILGDLVNRGPQSEAVLRRLLGYGASARCVLGNHDLHLLATACGARRPSRKDTLQCVLNAPDCHAMLEWLRHQNMALLERWGGKELLMVHAGVLPCWTAAKTMLLAREVESALRALTHADFFRAMYGNAPDAWDESLHGPERLRVIVNALTRLRLCTPQGQMEFGFSGGAQGAPKGYLPWFEVPGRQTADTVVAFGHWSTLGWLDRPNLVSLDTGCVWGGCLSALHITPGRQGWQSELIQVRCEQAQTPSD
jgi:bis(5'-nucleosyl)-tetraphosphatase (symmetrical)